MNITREARSGRGRRTQAVAMALALVAAGMALTLAVPPEPAAALTPYQAAVLANSPNDYWRMGDGVAKWTDEGPGGHDADSATGSDSASAPMDKNSSTSVARTFAGNDSKWTASNLLDASSAAITVELWFKVTAPVGAQTFFAAGTSCSSGTDITMGLNSSGKPTATVEMFPEEYANGELTTATAPSAATAGEWHHLAVTAGASKVTLYVDGLRAAQSISSYPYVSHCYSGTFNMSMGIAGGSATTLNTSLDEVAYYKKVLRASDIVEHYTASGRTDLLSNLERLGGVNPSEPCISCLLKKLGLGDPIDASNGNFYETTTDIAVPGRGVPLTFSRTYNSFSAAQDGWLGRGWTSTWSSYLDITSDLVTLYQDTGAGAYFLKRSGTWVPGPRVIGDLTHSGTAPNDTWTLVRNHTETLKFRSDGHLLSITDINGYETKLTYPGGSSHPTAVTESTTVTPTYGRSLTLAWDATGHLQSVTDPAGRRVTYNVNATTQNLDSVTGTMGGVTKFGYDSSHRMVSMQSPAQSAANPSNIAVGAATNAYDSQGRVVDQWSATAKSGATGVNTSPTHFDYGGENQTTVTDPEGNVTVQKYDGGRLLSVTRGSGTSDAGTWSFEYDAYTGGISKVTDPNGFASVTTWYGDCTGISDCASGRIHTTSNGIDPATTYTYDSVSGLVKSIHAPYGVDTSDMSTTTLTYDNHVNVKSVSKPLAGTLDVQTVTYTHGNPLHPEDVTAMSDPNLKSSSYVYNSYGDLLSSTDPNNSVRTSSYDLIGRPVASVSPEGNRSGGNAGANRSAVTYDKAGRPIFKLPTGSSPVADTFDRAAGSLGTADTSQTWTATAGTFAVESNQAKLGSAAGSANMATIAAGADLLLGFTSTVPQTDVGVVFRATDATHYWSLVASTSTNAWNLNVRSGGSTSTVATTGSSTCCMANQRVVVRAVGDKIKVFVDGAQKISITDAREQTATRVGLFAGATGVGRIDDFAAGLAISGASAVTYDANGSPIRTVGPKGNVSSATFDADGRELVATRPDGSTVRHGWNGNGSLTSYVDGASNATSYQYDHQGRMSSEQRPASAATTYTYVYSTAGERSVVTQPAGGTVTTTRDAVGRPISVDYSGSTPDLTIGYDHAGRQTSVTAAGGSPMQTTYDSLGRVMSTKRTGKTVDYRYDIANNETEVYYPGKATPVTRTYDDGGRLKKVKDWNDRQATFTYDADGKLTRTDFGTTSTVANTDEIQYTDSGEMSAVKWWQGTTSGTNLGQETYGHSAVDPGVVSSINPSGAAGSTAVAAGYDPLNQMTAVGTQTPTYDAANDLTRTDGGTYQTFNAAQQLCWSSPTTGGSCGGTKPSDATTFTYDPNGNRTTDSPVAGVETNYTYDQANRMTSAAVPTVTAGDGQFKAISAKRILDTRSGSLTGTCSPSPCGTLSPGTSVQVTVGVSPVPASGVSAVAISVTSLNATANGFLRVNPAPTGGAATINFFTGETANRFALVPVVNGKITLQTYVASTNVVVDVAGYYTDASGAGTDSYFPISPAARLADTRPGVNIGLCPTAACSTPAAGAALEVKTAGQAGIPSTGVSAVVVSVAVITPAADGFLRVGPASSGSGAAGTIDYDSGTTISDVVVVPVDSNGRIKLIASSSVNIVIDVSGYLTDPAPGASTGAVYRPISPVRALDTNTGSGTCTPSPCARLTATTQVKVKVRGSGVGGGSIPTDAAAVVAFISVKVPAATGFLRVNPVGSGTGSTGSATLNYNASMDGGVTVIAPVNSDDTITVAASSATDVVVDVSGYYQAASTSWAYHYDAAGVRDLKTDAAGHQTEFVYSGEGGLPLLLEQVGVSDTQYLIYGPSGMPIEQISSDGSAVWLHTDQLGSVRMTTAANSAAGTVGAQLRTQTFSAFGRQTAATGSGSSPKSLLGFAGEYSDAETGLLYLRARQYDPKSGQFMSVDPMVASTGQAYAYAGNNPVNASDPSGMCGFLGDGACSLSGVKEDVEDLCVKRGPEDDACETKADDFKKDHPETAQHVTNFAGGMLVLNPVTAPFVLSGKVDLARHGVDASSGWFYTGVATMGVIDIAGYCVIGQEAGVMTHWGEESPWVMNGPMTRLNWLKAGAAEPFESGVTTEAGRLSWPSGWQWVKGLFGQRIVG